MELQHVNAKLFVDGELPVAPARFIDIFHQWIRDNVFGELLIDVADYRHVPAGPGVMLIGHEGDYSLDNTKNRWGLRYNRKAALTGDNRDRFAQALGSAATACSLLESQLADEGLLTFRRNEIELFVNDRALAPNTPETFAAARPELESFLQATLGHDEFTIDHDADPRQRFGATVHVGRPFDLAAIVETLQTSA